MSRRTNKENRAVQGMEAMKKNQQPQVKVDVGDMPDIVCVSCGNYTFVPVMLMKKVSAFLTQSGKEEALPIQTYSCNACGFINPEFLPKFRSESDEKEAPESPIIT